MSEIDPFEGLNLTSAEKKKFNKLGFERPVDALFTLPLRYEDRTRIIPMGEAEPGDHALVEGIVLEHFQTKNSSHIYKLQDPADNTFYSVIYKYWYTSIENKLKNGSTVRLFGKIEYNPKYGNKSIFHPVIEDIDEPLSEGLTPVYPKLETWRQSTVRRIFGLLLDKAEIGELLDEFDRERLGFITLREALEAIHRPKEVSDVDSILSSSSKAMRRLKLEELLTQQLYLQEARRLRQKIPFTPLQIDSSLMEKFVDTLPFPLTGAQRRVIGEIRSDLEGPHPMMRLLQGDVGSGKTAVAMASALLVIGSGKQVALLAPTEILATQHFANLQNWAKEMDVECALLVGSMKEKEKAPVLAKIADGSTQLVIGTHAIIQEGVEFKSLRLAIIDEQHRFGVEQRNNLRKKGDQDGLHQLMMSATPIPRSLAMSYFSDLDVSVIDEMPPGRQPVKTMSVRTDRGPEVVGGLMERFKAGEQAYWVCPLIDESEVFDFATAIQRTEDLKKLLPDVNVALVHGQTPPDEKKRTMDAFKNNEIQLLVATTVIEVGVDVPNATVIVIENPERMGLAQLHQLRGRVGRGNKESLCILLFGDAISNNGARRIEILKKYQSGFDIAREDLRMRGPGEFLGRKQSGAPEFRFADTEFDSDILQIAKNLAEEAFDNGKGEEMMKRINMRAFDPNFMMI